MNYDHIKEKEAADSPVVVPGYIPEDEMGQEKLSPTEARLIIAAIIVAQIVLGILIYYIISISYEPGKMDKGAPGNLDNRTDCLLCNASMGNRSSSVKI